MTLTHPKIIYFKACLFVLCGLMACGIILMDHPSLRLAVLLAIAVWCFARAYYFVFYVIQHYVDPEYRFAGLGSFVAYLWRNRGKAQ